MMPWPLTGQQRLAHGHRAAQRAERVVGVQPGEDRVEDRREGPADGDVQGEREVAGDGGHDERGAEDTARADRPTVSERWTG
jgi:hypothetical protein